MLFHLHGWLEAERQLPCGGGLSILIGRSILKRNALNIEFRVKGTTNDEVANHICQSTSKIRGR